LLSACIFVGPRIGRFDENKKKYHIPGHSTPLTALGGFILIIGFLGMVMGHANNIELSAINIVLGGSASGLTAMFVKYSKPRLIFWERVKNQKIEIKEDNPKINSLKVGAQHQTKVMPA
jgi:Amt family ammonium transporter